MLTLREKTLNTDFSTNVTNFRFIQKASQFVNLTFIKQFFKFYNEVMKINLLFLVKHNKKHDNYPRKKPINLICING